MLYSTIKSLHIIAVILWLGGVLLPPIIFPKRFPRGIVEGKPLLLSLLSAFILLSTGIILMALNIEKWQDNIFRIPGILFATKLFFYCLMVSLTTILYTRVYVVFREMDEFQPEQENPALRIDPITAKENERLAQLLSRIILILGFISFLLALQLFTF